MIFGIVETHDQAFDVAGGIIGLEGVQLGAAAPNSCSKCRWLEIRARWWSPLANA